MSRVAVTAMVLVLATPNLAGQELLKLTGVEWMAWNQTTRTSILAGYVMGLRFAIGLLQYEGREPIPASFLDGKDMDTLARITTEWYRTTGMYDVPLYIAIYRAGLGNPLDGYKVPDVRQYKDLGLDT